MILMNKFIRIYSYLPYVIFMLMFRVLLLEEEKLAAAKNISYDVDASADSAIDFGDRALKDESGEAGELGEIYVAVIYPKSKEALFSRVVAQTVTSLSEEFAAATNLRVVPFYTVIGDADGYSVRDVQKACDAWNHKPIVAAAVFSSFRSGFAHVLTSLHNNIPVLWATGEVQAGYFERVPLSPFEIRLDPGSYEVLRSLRSLLLATHWHTFTIMHTTTILASKVYKDIVDQPPLLPTILQFQPDSTSNYIFRLLSDVSKSTKGVIVLICEGADAKRVIEESKKLNMVYGDFVWLWIDTGAMLVKERNVKLERISKESNFVVEMRKVRHIPNLYVDESAPSNSTTSSGHNQSSSGYEQPCRRDNNLVASNSTNSPICSNANRSTLYENKTDSPKAKLISNESIATEATTATGTSNAILPNHSKMAAASSSISALMKHHFSLYRKKSWRMKDDKYYKSLQQQQQPSSTRTPIGLKPTDVGSEQQNGGSPLSVINEETNSARLISANGGGVDGSTSKRNEKFIDNVDLTGSASNFAANRDAKLAKMAGTSRTDRPDSEPVEVAPKSSIDKRDPSKRAIDRAVRPFLNFTELRGSDETEAGSDAIRELTNVLKQGGGPNASRASVRGGGDSLGNVASYQVPRFVENGSVPALKNKTLPEMPVGVVALQLLPARVDKGYVRSSLKVLIGSLKEVIARRADLKLASMLDFPRISCFDFSPDTHHHGPISTMDEFVQNLKSAVREALAGRTSLNDTHFEELQNSSLTAKFKILNLVPEENIAHNKSGLNLSKVKKVNTTAKESRRWRTIGSITGEESVHLETIVWPGGDIVPVSTGRGSRSIFRIVTAFAPPFVMIGELDEDGQCLRGIECHQFLTSDKDNLTLLFNEMERNEEEIEVNVLDRIQAEKSKHIWDGIDDIQNHHFGQQFKTNCCYGLSMDLLENVAEELGFDFQLYIVADGLFGSKTFAENGEVKWNGIMGDLISGAAHMSFSPLSVSSSRSQFIDFSVPYFFSGVSFLAAPKASTDIPLLAFLLPFSANLWIAIFTSLNVTAIAVAIYEWLSPFGLNPWGRQRSKNFGIASAYWVLWALLCGHLIQFKAPKSWPNKFLINIWGGFSVIYIASYTANIAALIAGLFFHTAVVDHHDRSLLLQRVGAPKSSAAEYYIRSTNPSLWAHMQRYSVISVAEGVQLLKNGSLDILIADTPILDYYRATDHKCKLQKVGDTINEDTYAIGMMKGFPLKDSISAVIAKYSSNGYMDILQEKWYGALPCFKLDTDMAQPRPLGVAAVAGVFLMLGLGVLIGCLILFSEHLFYKYTLPSLRKKPKSSIWKSRNVMFFSQKLYRFINCVELVSPHHAARELVHTLKQGQITSLFQKSVRKKEHEQRQQQRKSKAQFFEMIQEIRRVQQEERKGSNKFDGGNISPRRKYSKNQQILLSPTGLLKHRSRLSPGRLDFARRLSKEVFRSKSSGNLEISQLGSDVSMSSGRFVDFDGAQAIGRRLSHGTADNSPPDINARRVSQFLRDDSSCAEGSPSGSDLLDFNATAFKGPSSTPSDTNVVKSPTMAGSSASSHVLSPRRLSGSIFSRDIGPVAARKFSNVDSSSFKGCKSKAQPKFCAPKLTLNNEDYLACEGGNCHEPSTELENEYYRDSATRTGSVRSNEHIVQIVIPSDAEETAATDEGDDRQAGGARRQRSSESDRRRRASERCCGASREEAPADDAKPKIILHLPRKKRAEEGKSSGSEGRPDPAAPLERLSVDELLSLAQLSEAELKESLLKAIAEKNPT